MYHAYRCEMRTRFQQFALDNVTYTTLSIWILFDVWRYGWVGRTSFRHIYALVHLRKLSLTQSWASAFQVTYNVYRYINWPSSRHIFPVLCFGKVWLTQLWSLLSIAGCLWISKMSLVSPYFRSTSLGVCITYLALISAALLFVTFFLCSAFIV